MSDARLQHVISDAIDQHLMPGKRLDREDVARAVAAAVLDLLAPGALDHVMPALGDDADDPPTCSRHQREACKICSLNPHTRGDLYGACVAYLETGMHSDACSDRISDYDKSLNYIFDLEARLNAVRLHTHQWDLTDAEIEELNLDSNPYDRARMQTIYETRRACAQSLRAATGEGRPANG